MKGDDERKEGKKERKEKKKKKSGNCDVGRKFRGEESAPIREAVGGRELSRRFSARRLQPWISACSVVLLGGEGCFLFSVWVSLLLVEFCSFYLWF